MPDNFDIAELSRRLNNLITTGQIVERDLIAARVRVQIGDLVTGWLPWLTTRASASSTWWAPDVNEQVLVLSSSGELANGIVLPALYRQAAPAPDNGSHMHTTVYDDGARVEYDSQSHTLSFSTPGTVNITAANINIDASERLSITGTGGDVLVSGISHVEHTHPQNAGNHFGGGANTGGAQ